MSMVRFCTSWVSTAPTARIFSEVAVVSMLVMDQDAEPSKESVRCPLLGADRKLTAGAKNDANDADVHRAEANVAAAEPLPVSIKVLF